MKKLSKKTIKIMICEDHPLMRKALADFFEGDEHVEIIGQFANGKELLDAVSKEEPHIVLLDIQMPLMSGAEVLEVLNKNHKEIKVIIFSSFCDGEDTTLYYFEKGASAVVPKNKSVEDLTSTIVAVLADGSAIPEKVLKTLLRKDQQDNGRGADHLTTREEEVIKLICKEKSDKEIADMLNVSVSTVKFHKLNLYKKTKSSKSAGLFKYAIKRGLVEF